MQGATDRVAIEVDAGLGSGKTRARQGGGGRGRAGGGSYPTLGGGMSCEAAQARYVEDYEMGDTARPTSRRAPTATC